jgi:hypothetical protein
MVATHFASSLKYRYMVQDGRVNLQNGTELPAMRMILSLTTVLQ